MNTLVVGGGIIGLSVAWQLQKAGIQTTLIDASTGINTSYVAAGMLAPYVESPFDNPEWFRMAKVSLQLYPNFLNELHHDSGLRIEFEKTGTLLVGVTYDDSQWLQYIYTQKCEQQIETQFLTSDQAREKEPLLSPKVTHALWIEQDAQLDNQQLLQALKIAFSKIGGEHISPLSIHSILSQKGKVMGVLTVDQKKIPTNRVIICAGAFSSKFGVKIRPIKGEILTLKSPYALSSMIRSPRVYLTPKPQNIVRVGATQIEKGYTITYSALAIRMLLQEAWEILPSIDEMELISSEVGLRPCSDHHLPIIKKAEPDGVYYATGHGRAGILLAPYTANLIKEKVLCKLN